jgi:hypothetical protein
MCIIYISYVHDIYIIYIPQPPNPNQVVALLSAVPKSYCQGSKNYLHKNYLHTQVVALLSAVPTYRMCSLTIEYVLFTRWWHYSLPCLHIECVLSL